MPGAAWGLTRAASLAAVVVLCATLVTAPRVGLLVFWDVVAPLLPLLFILAPGLWRNICPVAALNQSPRLLRLSRGRSAPPWVQRHGYLVGFTSFIAIVATRTLVFEISGPALAALLAGLLAAAFFGGLWVRGKAGWCTSVCPLVPVERLYGQAPFAVVRNSHCQPCVGCTRHCYDLSPTTAHLAERETDRVAWLRRRLFAGVFPGLTLWLFLAPPGELSSLRLLGMALLLSAGSFFVLDALLPAHRAALPAVYAALTLNLYYAFTGPEFLALLGARGAWPGRALQAAVFALSVAWLIRALRAAREYDRTPVPRRRLPVFGAPQATATRISSGMSKFE